MSFGLSPSIDIKEKQFLTPGQQVGANRFAGMIGNFNWGTVGELVFVTEEKDIAEIFHTPDDNNFDDWFNAVNYTAYNNKLYLGRAIKEVGSFNAGLALFSEFMKALTLNTVVGAFEVSEVVTGSNSLATGIVTAIEDGVVYIKVTAGVFEVAETITGTDSLATAVVEAIEDDMVSSPLKVLRKNYDHEAIVLPEEFIKFKILARYPGDYGNKISIAIANHIDFPTAKVIGATSFKSIFEFAPLVNEIAVVVLINDTIAEAEIVSLVPGTKNYKGQSSYIVNMFDKSKYIYVYDNTEMTTVVSIESTNLVGGVHMAPDIDDIINAYELFANGDGLDIDMIFDAGHANLSDGHLVQQFMLDNVADERRDLRVILSPRIEDVINLNITDAVDNLIDYVSNILVRDTSFGAFYGNAKYQYDKYNDKYRWVSIGGDVAGIYAVSEAWEAPAGINRATIKNCEKLAINPKEGYRDIMYPVGINPIYTMKNVGHVIMGQKTLKTSVPSLFSRVDNRGLFNLLEKNAVFVAKFYQFQKNNPFERRRFVADIEPLYKQLMGVGAIEEYLIICNETNNTDEVKDQLLMIADIYVKPYNSIEWIRLNFNATQATVNFEEIVSSPFA